MSQFELIEEYLTNRLDAGAREAFEQRMEGDPQLKAEVEFQNTIIEGVKTARVAELKAMLSNVPIGAATTGAVAGKIALATISAAIIGTAIYFGFKDTSTEPVSSEQTIVEESIDPGIQPQQDEPMVELKEEEISENKTETVAPKKTPSKENAVKTKPATPKIDVVDLSEEMNDSNATADAPTVESKPTISTSTIEVETDNSSKSYSFHYQFKDDKLLLYGPFDASLYEIIEINGGSHHVFLYYNKCYYHLDELDTEITPLIMIRDFELLNRLENFRNKK